MPGGGELRFPKTIPRGSIGVQPFEISWGGTGGGSCGDLPDAVTFVFLLSFFFFSLLCFLWSFLCLSLIILRLLLLLCEDASSLFTRFLWLQLALAAKEGLKTGEIEFLVVELCWTGFVCRLRGVVLPCIEGQVSVRWRFAWLAGQFECLFFQGIYWFGLPSDGVFVVFGLMVSSVPL